MDTLAHGLWTYILGRKTQPRSNWHWLVFFGIFPDLVWLPFTALSVVTSGQIVFFQGPYNISHSVVIWALVSALLMFRWRRAFYFTWPWALHILIDIPGHLDMHTPIFWPISSFKISGAWDWLTPWWLLANYLVLAGVFPRLWWSKRKRRE